MKTSPIQSILGQTVADHAEALKNEHVGKAYEFPKKFQELMNKVNAEVKPKLRSSAVLQKAGGTSQMALTKPGLSEMTAKQLSQHVDNFLKLLMTQLKHQDPLNPMEATDFTAQLVQLTGVEQQIAMNTKFDSMINLQKHSQDLGASHLIDRKVQVPGDTIPFDGTTLELAFVVPPHLQEGYLVIKDAQGQIVHIKDVQPTGEYQNYRWNGVRDDGSLAGPGIYTTQIIATNEAGEPQTLGVSMLGKVTGVYFEGGEARLVVAGQIVNADSVQAVHMLGS